MTEEDKIIEEYLADGTRELHSVYRIDSIRDGGNIVIKTSKGNYYIDNKTYKVYREYPLDNKYEIRDTIGIKYLILRIETYLDREQKQIERNREKVGKLKLTV